MASPQLQEFCIVDASTGVEVIGATIGPSGIHFSYYKDETGANLSMPTITEKGGGWYGFLPVFTTGHCIQYSIQCGSAYVPSVVSNFLRPEDYAAELLDTSTLSTKLDELLDLGEGRWTIEKTGPNANRLVLYDRNGALLGTCDLLDSLGNPTSVNPYTRSVLVHQGNL